MGASNEIASSAIRFSLGKQTSEEEIDAVGEAIQRVLARLTSSKKARSEAYAVV